MRYSSQKFKNVICYLNPPYRGDYIQLAVTQIIQKEINCYVLLPVWVSAGWYNLVLQYAKRIVEIPDGSKYFESPSYMTLRATKKWNIILVLFIWSDKMKCKYYRYYADIQRVKTIQNLSKVVHES